MPLATNTLEDDASGAVVGDNVGYSVGVSVGDSVGLSVGTSPDFGECIGNSLSLWQSKAVVY